MLPFAHLGIGSEIVRPWRKTLALKWLLLGTVLPDLIDKPLFYLASHTEFLALIAGKRNIAHTALFVLVMAFFSKQVKSKAWAACSLGVASHLLLDFLSKFFSSQSRAISKNLEVLLWPAFGFIFPPLPEGVTGSVALLLEFIGVILLIRTLWQLRNQKTKAINRPSEGAY